MFTGNGSIIKDVLALSCDTIPDRIFCRDDQMNGVLNNLKPVLKGINGRSMFLHGPPGSGKTCISRHVLGEFEMQASGVKTVYINCWENPSRFKILYKLMEQMGMVLSVHRKGMPTDELTEALAKKLEGKKAVFVLDEVDQLEDGKVLYDLMLIPGLCLVMIANDEDVFSRLDPRIMSRLAMLDRIKFPQYGQSELAEILKDRADLGLMPGVVKRNQLERIANASSGDARVAINMLRIIAESAENDDLMKISDYYVEKVMQNSMAGLREKAACGFNQYQQFILQILKKNKNMDSTALFAAVSAAAAEKKLEPIVDRTFRNYMDKLISANYVSVSGNGRWRVFSLA